MYSVVLSRGKRTGSRGSSIAGVSNNGDTQQKKENRVGELSRKIYNGLSSCIFLINSTRKRLRFGIHVLLDVGTLFFSISSIYMLAR